MSDFACGHHSRTLWIDNGSSFWKSGLLGFDRDDLSLVGLKKASSICASNGIISAAEFISYAFDIVRHIEAEVKESDADRICFTGIREGVVLCDENGKVVCALTNRILGSLDEKREARSIVEVGRGLFFMSIQGYVFRCLTGRTHITMSEARAISCFFDDLCVDPRLSSVKPAPVIAAGKLIDCTATTGVCAALCGTDEQASVLGAKCIAGSDYLLSTGTFWSLSMVTTPSSNYADRFGGRLVDGDGVLPPFTAMIGYRWGELFWSLLHGHCPSALDDLPPWAAGQLVNEAARGRVRQLEHAIDLASGDIADWIGRLTDFGRDRYPLAIAVRRTDSPVFQKVIEPLLVRIPCEAVYFDHDPTAAGAFLAAHLHTRS